MQQRLVYRHAADHLEVAQERAADLEEHPCLECSGSAWPLVLVGGAVEDSDRRPTLVATFDRGTCCRVTALMSRAKHEDVPCRREGLHEWFACGVVRDHNLAVQGPPEAGSH